MPAVPKPQKFNRTKKKKKSKLQAKKDNPNSAYWKRQCDKAFGVLWHNVYSKNKCIIGCNCKGNIEMHHAIPREILLFRWDTRNMMDLCSKHHRFDFELSAHQSPIVFSQWMQLNRPDQYEFVRINKDRIIRKQELPWNLEEKFYQIVSELSEHGITLWKD